MTIDIKFRGTSLVKLLVAIIQRFGPPPGLEMDRIKRLFIPEVREQNDPINISWAIALYLLHAHQPDAVKIQKIKRTHREVSQMIHVPNYEDPTQSGIMTEYVREKYSDRHGHLPSELPPQHEHTISYDIVDRVTVANHGVLPIGIHDMEFLGLPDQYTTMNIILPKKHILDHFCDLFADYQSYVDQDVLAFGRARVGASAGAGDAVSQNHREPSAVARFLHGDVTGSNLGRDDGIGARHPIVGVRQHHALILYLIRTIDKYNQTLFSKNIWDETILVPKNHESTLLQSEQDSIKRLMEELGSHDELTRQEQLDELTFLTRIIQHQRMKRSMSQQYQQAMFEIQRRYPMRSRHHSNASELPAGFFY
jgi:hypothetical protein